MEERIEALERRVKQLEEEKELLIGYPHTIWNASSMLLGLQLTREQRRKAGLLAYKMFTHVHSGSEPARFELFGENVSRYADVDAWIVRLAVQKTASQDCAGPSDDQIPNETWLQMCAEVRAPRDMIYTD